jgi:hypothetical protein
MKNLDLDVDTPEKVAGVLRDAADAYYQAESELSSAWDDPNAGKVWTKIARILERAAVSIDKATRNYY